MYHDPLNGLIQAAGEETGIEKHATCHTFRHTRRDAPPQGRGRHPAHPEAPRPRLAHSTERYTHVEISDLKEVIRRAHPRGR